MKAEAELGRAEQDEMWESLSLGDRQKLVAGLRQKIARRQEEIVQTVARESGKPVTEVLSQEVTATLEMLRYFETRYPRRLRPQRFRCRRPGFWAKANTIVFEPLGTIGLIGPANFPFSLPVLAAAASLLCGNKVVFKPAEKCPSTARLIGRLFHESGFPDPAFETVEGGEEAAQEVIGRPSVRKVIFFGGYEAGNKVAALSGQYFKPCILELGACGTAIVRADANLRRTAQGLAWSAFYAAGRSCLGTKVVYAHAPVKERLAELLAEEMSRLRTGEPLDPATDVSARREEQNPPWVERFIDVAKERGATVRTSAGATLVVLDVQESGRLPLPDEEIAWPFLAVCPVDSDEEALRAANGSAYSLGASIWTRDMKTARAMAERLQAGLVWVNDTSVGMPQVPWGGAKRSGWGRLFSELAVSELTSTTVVSIESGRSRKGKFWWFPYGRKKCDLLVAVNSLVYGQKRLKTLFSILSSFF
jgi:acyl-CoA reductase-like NAD-dependent aldehyde dehydrogenase